MKPSPISDYSITKVADAAASATNTATVNLDMSQYDSVLFMSSLGTPNAGNYFKVSESSASDYSGAADLLGSKLTPTGTNSAGVLLTVERPAKPYLTLTVVRAGTASVIGDVWAIRYHANKPVPITNATGAVAVPGTVFVKTLADPTEGTA